MSRNICILAVFSGLLAILACQAPKQEGEYTSREPIPTSAGHDVAITITEERFEAPPVEVREGEEFPQVVLEWNSPEMLEYRIGPRDLLKVILFYSDASVHFEVQVLRDGSIMLPLIGRIDALDKTPEELQEILLGQYSNYYIDPGVEVRILDYRSHLIYVMGVGFNSKEIPLKKRTTMVELLDQLGAFLPYADLRGAYLQRNEKIYPFDFKRLLEGDLSLNYELMDNDIIHLNSLKDTKIFILGEVRRPGVQEMKVDDDLFWALARAGGPTESAQMHDVRIIRGGLTNPTLITVDIKILFKRRAPRQLNTEDLRRLHISAEAGRRNTLALEKLYLQNDDFIFVPRTALAHWNDIMREISPTLSFIYTQPAYIAKETVFFQETF